MNFKIENNYLNISNYPSIERHFEKMASKGWLINKIIAGSLFIYKKIEAEELDFSISPYEVETAFTRKSKRELEEFQTVCKNVGWNYATKTYDLHIYFKEKGTEAVPIQTDEEEEFKTLEIIGKKQLRAQYWQIPLFIFLAWSMIGRSITSVYGMRDGLGQIVSLLLPIGIVLGLLSIIDLRSFLKKNRKNIDLGNSIEFNDSRFYGFKICHMIFNILILVFILYFIYTAIILRNRIILMAFIPVLIGTIIGTLYRIFVKPSKRSTDYKKMIFVVIMLAVFVIPTSVGVLNIGFLANREGEANIDGYRVLSINDFTDKGTVEDYSNLRKNVSILIPKSYEYSSYYREQGYLETEYSKVLNESLAKNLVNRYKREAENRIRGRNSEELRIMFENDTYFSFLSWTGFTEADFNSLKHKDTKEAIKDGLEIIKQRSIVEDKDNLWAMDEVYFLDYDKDEVVIRNGKEVFYLEGLDFSDPQVIEIVKDRLDLN